MFLINKIVFLNYMNFNFIRKYGKDTHRLLREGDEQIDQKENGGRKKKENKKIMEENRER